MGYAGYAPGHKVAELATPLQQRLAQVRSDASLETMSKLTRNTAQAPAEEKFRKVRLTNPKISAVITEVPGAKEAMLEMGWVEEGEFLVLPTGTNLTMKEVREIDDAQMKNKKREEEEFKKRLQANKRSNDPEKERLRLQMEADRKERAARGPVTQGSVAVPKGTGGFQTASAAGCAGSKGG